MPTAPTMSETIGLLENRVSVRKFEDRPVPGETVNAVLKAAFRAPTSSNVQAYSVIVVRDPAIRDRLAKIAGGQAHVSKAPVFLAFCADLTHVERAVAKAGQDFGGADLEMSLVASIDASLVGMAAYLAAESLGLKGVMIGGLRNNPVDVAAALGLPKRVYSVFGMCLGFPAGDPPPQKPRMDFSQMVHDDRYGAVRDERSPEQALGDYDATLAAHYRAIGKETTDNSWSHEVGGKFYPQPRPNLARQLAELGFDFA
ncbi:MAG: NADPH-dependent oxidoreductase [Rhodospirillales bacterium]|nr:NADPH-dependent oxidoreductase [Rhodospirillales bacterium]